MSGLGVGHPRRSPCCADEARRYLVSEGVRATPEPAPAVLDEDGPRVWAPITPDLRAALAAAMNEVDRRSAEEQWPASVSPHHAGCVHVAALAEALAATPAALPSEAKP